MNVGAMAVVTLINAAPPGLVSVDSDLATAGCRLRTYVISWNDPKPDRAVSKNPAHFGRAGQRRVSFCVVTEWAATAHRYANSLVRSVQM